LGAGQDREERDLAVNFGRAGRIAGVCFLGAEQSCNFSWEPNNTIFTDITTVRVFLTASFGLKVLFPLKSSANDKTLKTGEIFVCKRKTLKTNIFFQLHSTYMDKNVSVHWVVKKWMDESMNEWMKMNAHKKNRNKICMEQKPY